VIVQKEIEVIGGKEGLKVRVKSEEKYLRFRNHVSLEEHLI
jgi:hypothetical protein